jgi:hypothetical protein
MIKFTWEKFDRQELARLRQEFNLEEVVAAGRTEFEKQLLLKDWVYRILPKGNNSKPGYKNAIDILGDRETGEFYCSHFALVYLQCATVLGWYCRKLGVDFDHPQGVEERHHGVVDIWSNQFQKWFVVDAQHNQHYEKEGIPLNAAETRGEYLRNKAVDVNGIISNHSLVVSFNENSFGFNTPSNYFWFFILLRNNFFEDPDVYNSKSLLWVDELNENKIWYKGGGTKGESKPHPMYESQFIKTSDLDLCFPTMKG